MKQEELFTEAYIPDITMEDFDQMEEQHVFSKEYQRNKKKMLKEYRRKMTAPAGKQYWKAAVAALVITAVVPFGVNAATNGEFFNRIWGNEGRDSIESHNETVYEEEKNKSYEVTYPKREYVETDEVKAQELIGENVSHEPIVEQMGDTTLTILSTVYDGNSAVVEFTLEREGGVNALNYSQLDNEAKGAWVSDESMSWFHFVDCGENIYVDLEKSTDDILYCYDYVGFDSAMASLNLEIVEYPCKRGEYFAAAETMKEEDLDAALGKTTTRTVSIPLQKAVSSGEFVNPEGGSITISPISMTIDTGTGLGLSKEEANDPGNIYYVGIRYKDGSEYLVCETNAYKFHEDGTEELVHKTDVETDNTSYALGRMNQEFLLVFNRLVDVDSIETITVNDTTYTISR